MMLSLRLHRSFKYRSFRCVALGLFTAHSVVVLPNTGRLTNASPSTVQAQAAKPGRTVWDGVYTEEEAERGREVYRRTCTYCHGRNLQGGSETNAPALAGHVFLIKWRNRPLSDLFAVMAQTMPKEGSGSPPVAVELEEYLDLIAYVLSVNRMPAGKNELPTDERLQEILITEKPMPR